MSSSPKQSGSLKPLLLSCSPERGIRPWDGRTPLTQAGAIIYIVTRFPNGRGVKEVVTLEDVATVTSVAASTIRLVAQEMQPYVKEFLPSALATSDEIPTHLKL